MMTSSPPSAWTDLTAAAEAFQGDARYRRLINAIDRYAAVDSARADLEYAQQRLKLSGEVAGSHPDGSSGVPDDEDKATIASALLVHAVILYVRATKTSSRYRGRVPFTRR